MFDRVGKLHLCTELDAQLSALKTELNDACIDDLGYPLRVQVSVAMIHSAFTAMKDFVYDDLDPSQDIGRLWP